MSRRSPGADDVAQLERKGHALIAEGHALLAKVAGMRSQGAADTWMPVTASPLGKRRTLALARRGVIESAKVGRKVVIRASSLDAFLEEHRRSAPDVDNDDLFGAAATPRAASSSSRSRR